METQNKTKITVAANINQPIEKIWEFWNNPEHIKEWAKASDDWHVPYADNDLQVNGNFKTTMAAKDGSFSFDFGGIYTKVDEHKQIEYTMGDGRKVQITFSATENGVVVTETFEAEDTNPIEMQEGGWQAILNNFKKYTEAN